MPSIFQNLTSKETFFKISLKKFESFYIFLYSFSLYLEFGNLMHFELLYFYNDYHNDFSTSFYSYYGTAFQYFYKTFLYYRNILTFFNYFFVCYILEFYYFMFCCLFFLVFVFLLCVFVNILHVSNMFTNLSDYDSSSGSVIVHIHANIDKDANCF